MTSPHFLGVASELRNRIYELTLLYDEPINPKIRSWCEPIGAGLLYVNKTIHQEAISFFYGHNCFDLTRHDMNETTRFFEKIGRKNSSYIRHLCISCPSFSQAPTEYPFLEANSSAILDSILEHCTNIITITLALPDLQEFLVSALTSEDKSLRRTLQALDSSLRAIPSLQSIVAETPSHAPFGESISVVPGNSVLDSIDPKIFYAIKEEHEKNGWIIKRVRTNQGEMWDERNRDYEDQREFESWLNFEEGDDYIDNNSDS